MTAAHLAAVARCRALVAGGDAARIRISARLSQAEMAGAVGVSTAAIAHYEAGRRMPKGDIAMRYLRVLDRLDGAGESGRGEAVSA